MNKDEKSAYNRAYRIAHKARIEANRAARRAGLSAQPRRCQVIGCGNVYDAGGYCARHYMAFRRHGDPLAVVQSQHHGLTLVERFALRVHRTGGCWEWIGARNHKGYGVMRTGETNTLAHRISYELQVGPISDGMSVLHRCDNPSCVNPNHLFLGTAAQNNADMDAKGRRRSNPKHGHENPMAKLTEAKVRRIRTSTARGVDLAARYGVSQTVISAIRTRRIWKHVP